MIQKTVLAIIPARGIFTEVDNNLPLNVAQKHIKINFDGYY